MSYRQDGYSLFCRKDLGAEMLRSRYVDCFKGSAVSKLVWGVGPGGVLCYDTRTGDVVGRGLTAAQKGMLRDLDLQAIANVERLIASGNDPLRLAIGAAHEAGLSIVPRYQLNHEFDPPSAANWRWVFSAGRMSKEHPEFLIPGHANLDFRFPEVRARKLEVVREIVTAGSDGIQLDFRSGPPFFARPDAAIMTAFIRDVRSLLDEEGRRRGHHLDLACRLPHGDTAAIGLDWKQWMDLRLIDAICPFQYFPAAFDLNLDDYVSLGHRTGCRVIGEIWFALGLTDADPRPGDEKRRIRRHDKPKTAGMYYAQGLLFQRQGVDEIQLGMSSDEWHRLPFLKDLNDPEKLRFADKHYMADFTPVVFERPDQTHTGILRLADDPGATGGPQAQTDLVLTMDPLGYGEELVIDINGIATIRLDSVTGPKEPMVMTSRPRGQDDFMIEPNWWQKGSVRLGTPPACWRLGTNEIRLTCRAAESSTWQARHIRWLELLIDYRHCALDT